MSTKIACPICRENHEPRTLVFDGFGVNSCGMYRSRLATLSKDCHESLGSVFAAGPELLQACISALADIEDFYTNNPDMLGEFAGTESLLTTVIAKATPNKATTIS